MREFEIKDNDSSQRLDKFIPKSVWDMPKSLMYKYIRKKRIKVNGKKAAENYILQTGDTVQMYIPDEVFKKNAEDREFTNVKTDLCVLYEDSNILIVDKEPGVLVHADDRAGKDAEKTVARNTLIFHIQAYLYQKKEYDPLSENTFAPALCNRIDRNTGGIVIAAKNALSLREMNELIKNNGIEKIYLCAVHGLPCPENAVLRAFLVRNTQTKTVSITDFATRGSKEIITEYRTLDYDKSEDLALLCVKLITGRTHQIRAHLSYIGHPLLGEGKYTENKSDRAAGYAHQALYACKLRFLPTDGMFSYLAGREFKVQKSHIRFLELFPKYRV